MMLNREKKSRSIMQKMLVPMLAVTLMQAGLFYGTTMLGGTINQLNHNSVDILSERVLGRKNYLQNEMIERWSAVSTTVEEVQDVYKTMRLSQGLTPERLANDTALSSTFLSQASEKMIYMLRKNSVTGAFIFLTEQTENPGTHSALYIRDMDPASNPADNADLLLEIAAPSLARSLKISLDAPWVPAYSVENGTDKGAFFKKPLAAAIEYPDIGYKDLGYWGRPLRLQASDMEIVTYAVPLRTPDGAVYGVLGVEIALDYIRRALPYDEIDADKRGSYLLAVDDDDDLSFSNVLITGPSYKQISGEGEKTVFLPDPAFASGHVLQRNDKMYTDYYGCLEYLRLYNTNTPFENERWALAGVLQERDLLEMGNRVQFLLVLSMGVSLVIGILGIFIISTLFTRPVTTLMSRLKESDPGRPVRLENTHIAEIDELAHAVESLSASVADSASKLTRIIRMANIPLGAFEYQRGAQTVFCAGRLTEMFDLVGDGKEGEIQYVTIQVFKRKLRELNLTMEGNADDPNEHICEMIKTDGQLVWYRIHTVAEEKRFLGVVTDITKEVKEKKKIEHERDYDLLTNLLNRRAFYAQLGSLFAEPQCLKTAAMMMMDLDNLKYINDTYGHDYGDAYISGAASALKKFVSADTLVSRMSGDEFLIFFFGRVDKETLRSFITQVKDEVSAASLYLPSGAPFKIRASAGIAWYPDDTDNPEQLVRYADFAMYEVKNSVKGALSEFSIASYNRDSYLLYGKEELNKLIDGRLVEYAFQPIVEAATGTVFAYEALMRSQLSSLKSPFEILSLARAQSQLYQMEKLTWFKAMEDFAAHEVEEHVFLFINSIANQVLSPADISRFETLYAPYLSKIVIELTEEEKTDAVILQKKRDFASRWGCRFALDDFGAGYNGEAILLTTQPQFVKVDMSIIRGIDVDVGRQKMLHNLVSFSKGQNILVIAEGIETRAEMEVVVSCGVHFMQGYYLGMPDKIPRGLRESMQQEILQAGKNIPSQERLLPSLS